MKKLISLLLIIILSVSFSVSAAAEQTVLDSSDQVMTFCLGNDGGVLSVTRGVLCRDGVDEEAYLVCLEGTSWLLTRGNNIFSYLRSCMFFDTSYVHNARRIITLTVPAGSKIILAGHSLGGMTAQQLAADSTLKSRYEIINVLACGSPLILTENEREGELHRLADVTDIIPTRSLAGSLNYEMAISFEDGNYNNSSSAHSKSYKRADLWNSYDVLGVKDGEACFSYDFEDVHHFTTSFFEIFFLPFMIKFC